MSKHILVLNFQCIFGNVGQVDEKCNLHCCKQHILNYNIYRNRNPSISPSFLFLASNICNFCDYVIFLTYLSHSAKNALEVMCLDTFFVILEANKYISEAVVSNFSVFVRSVGTWFIVGRKSQFQVKPKGQNRMPKSGTCKETNKFLTFSWHSHASHNAQSSVLFYVHCSVQVAEYFLKILGFYL